MSRIAPVVVLLAVLACSPLSEEQRLQRMADQTQVCIQNDREHYARVALRDDAGSRVATIPVMSFSRECKWTELDAGDYVTGIIYSTSAPTAVPPAWREMLVGNRTIRLTIGQDGATPFAHSSRRQ